MSKGSLSTALSPDMEPSQCPQLTTGEPLKNVLGAPAPRLSLSTFCSPTGGLRRHEKLHLWKSENLICAPVVK